MKAIRLIAVLIVAVAALLPIHGDCIAAPQRPSPPPEVAALGASIREIQRSVVTPGGDEYNPGYSDRDRADFIRSHKLRELVETFRRSVIFARGVAALRRMPPGARRQVLAKFREPIDPTWAETGSVGNGTTEAGQAVEIMIARALAAAVEGAISRHVQAVSGPQVCMIALC